MTGYESARAALALLDTPLMDDIIDDEAEKEYLQIDWVELGRRMESFSRGEHTIVKFAFDLWNSSGGCTVLDLLSLDRTNRKALIDILAQWR